MPLKTSFSKGGGIAKKHEVFLKAMTEVLFCAPNCGVEIWAGDKFMQKGKIVILNGTRCSGKTTTAKALQERLDDPYFLLDFDRFITMSPEKYFTDGTVDNRKTVNKSLSIMHHAIKAASNMGINTIVEYIFLNIDTLLEECVGLLHEYPVLFVRVTCPLEELRRREKERGGYIGYCESQISCLTPQDTYDIKIDTSREDCVDKIIELLNYPEKFSAFKTLWSQQIQ